MGWEAPCFVPCRGVISSYACACRLHLDSIELFKLARVALKRALQLVDLIWPLATCAWLHALWARMTSAEYSCSGVP